MSLSVSWSVGAAGPLPLKGMRSRGMINPHVMASQENPQIQPKVQLIPGATSHAIA